MSAKSAYDLPPIRKVIATMTLVIATGCSSVTSISDSGPDSDLDAGDADTEDADVDVDEPMPTSPASGTCWTVVPVDGTLAILEVDLAAGTWRDLGRRGQDVSIGECMRNLSLGIVGGSILASQRDSLDLIAVDLESGETRGVETLGGKGLASYETGVVRIRASSLTPGLAFYTDLDSVLDGVPSRTVLVEVSGDTIAAAAGRAYTMDSIFGDGTISVIDISSMEVEAELRLEGSGSTPTSLAASGDRLLALVYTDANSSVASFDAETGAFIDSIALIGTPGTCRPAGLTCADEGR
jgi:hypothetical protein